MIGSLKPVCCEDGSFDIWLRPSRYMDYMGLAFVDPEVLQCEYVPDCMASWVDRYGGAEVVDYTTMGLIHIHITFPSRDIAALFKLTWCV